VRTSPKVRREFTALRVYLDIYIYTRSLTFELVDMVIDARFSVFGLC
jgi:hypothetical protein